MHTLLNKFTPLLIIASSLAACQPSLKKVMRFAPTESFPEDSYLSQVPPLERRALVIVAHDDDDCAMSGTIAKLTADGWEIQQLSLAVTPLAEGRKNHPASLICQGNSLILEDGHYQNWPDSAGPPYMPIPREQFADRFLLDKVEHALVQRINSFDPAVIFTLDNEIGGYGNPEHVWISQLVLDLADNGDIHPKRIYQSVITDHMEKAIIDEWLAPRLAKWGYPSPYHEGQKVYGVNGLPAPSVEVNIKDQASTKMAYLRAYHEDARKNLRKFIPYYEDYPAEDYFGLFDREFFRVIRFGEQ